MSVGVQSYSVWEVHGADYSGVIECYYFGAIWGNNNNKLVSKYSCGLKSNVRYKQS